ncbi:MAG TPA: hypothetical protein PKU97_22290, partial [Kofleriaceae bacterium]|nr:hypothetical protein [Kofleriaceae bacterium]
MTSDLLPADPAREFVAAVQRLRAWTHTVPASEQVGEWECNYEQWGELYAVWRRLLSALPVERWDPSLVSEALFALARDNECQALAHDLAALGVPPLVRLAAAARTRGEPDARWQLAHELGLCAGGSGAVRA